MVVKPFRPLADLLRPKSLEEILGQDHILGEGGFLYAYALDETLLVPSLILWGPPGCGKTTLARVLAKRPGFTSVELSALESGVQDIRSVFKQAELCRAQGKILFLFLDEIHRFNRAQQDIFLHALEKGDIILCGATTENPSFELNRALLSRCQVVSLKPLEAKGLECLVQKAEAFLGRPLPLQMDARQVLLDMAQGDGRALVGAIDIIAAQTFDQLLDKQSLLKILQKKPGFYDKNRDAHYDFISTLHKAIRGSDVDAALYWLARMLEGGENPLYILRRLIRCALEDIGLADPQALQQALLADQAYRHLGSPEGDLAVHYLVVYLATAPKSNAVYKAAKKAQELAKTHSSLQPPLHSVNASTALMKQKDYGKGYVYDHDLPDGFSGLNYFPEKMTRTSLYTPVQRGFERDIFKRLIYWDALRKDKNKT